MSKAPAIGIDLGTCDCCAAVFQNGKVEIIPSDFQERATPSYVSFTEKERFIGSEAKLKKNRNSQNTIVNAKRLIGHKFSDKEIQQDIIFSFYMFKGFVISLCKAIVLLKNQGLNLWITCLQHMHTIICRGIISHPNRSIRKRMLYHTRKILLKHLLSIPIQYNNSYFIHLYWMISHFKADLS